MERIFSAIVKRKKTVIIAFVVISVVCVFLMLGVGQNYDMSKYLPSDSESKVGIDILTQEYAYNGSAVMMVQDKSIVQILEMKENIETIPGIERVVWLDDIYDLKQPIELIDEEIRNNYMVGDDALLQLVFTEDDYAEGTQAAIDELKVRFGDDVLISGSAVDAYMSIKMISGNILTGILAAVGAILLILLLSTTSFFEVFLFLVTIGVAILLNMGTNVIFGEISYMTFACVAILQLAISMDYSIFLLHRFEQERKTEPIASKAMVNALKASFTSIFSSGLTTIVGFLALIFMSYTIGADMGLVFAKGIFFSLLSVLTFLPALAVLSVKLIDKTKHRKILPSMKRIQRLLGGKVKYVVLGLLVLISVISFMAQSNNTFLYSAENGEADDEVTASQVIEEKFGSSNLFVVLVPRGNGAAEYDMSRELEDIPVVKSVQGYYSFIDYAMPTQIVPDDISSEFFSEGYSRYIVEVDVPIESDESFRTVEQVRSVVGSRFDEAYVTGATPVTYDIKESASGDFSLVTLLSILFVGIILLFTFKSATLPIILLFVIETSIWLNMSFPYFSGSPMNFIGFMVISAVQLGATIDYAILMTTFYREGRLTLGKREAAEYAADKAGASILVSTLVLASAGFIVSFTLVMPAMSQLGALIGRGALLSGGITIIMLPQLLTLLDKVITKTTINRKLFVSRRRK
ncbi:MAG: MMPL family transporter [Clostridia bacterium]|nr:MMPL family transporter [Clostridia bacterium]MBT7123021.1 MMPL family transporter [Clostridia bacterium]